ncbi:hypothetical protein ACH5RR_007659 [Cinchona calisaya]|uniref:RING-type E3 ubiquitin transferase n=1 Tax=Cinchona calisaya TaxID=153742 RepID=A0ABD3AC02_9GENT
MDLPSDGFLLLVMVDDRYGNFYYSSISNLWTCYNITPGPIYTNVAFYSTCEQFLPENNNRDYISSMLQEANIPLQTHSLIIPKIEEIAMYMANEPANASPRLLPILVEITRWNFFHVSSYLAEEVYGIGNANTFNIEDNNILDQVLNLSIEENEPRLSPASRDNISEMLTKVTIEATDGVEACTICLENFSEGLEVSQIPCKHIFHEECILQWLNYRNVCPLCRFEISVASNS